MSGLVGIIGNDAARFHEFTSCSIRLQAPDGWAVEMLIGGDWCGARNDLVDLTLEGGYSHLWFMDDDHSFSPDILLKLLAHDVAIVNPVCLTRTWPFLPCVYPSKLPEGEHVYLPLDFADHEPEGLVEIEAGGCAGMLIRRDVLEAVKRLPGRPFEYGDRSEDIVFCEKAKACGFTLYADLGTMLGHITTAVVQPSYDAENGWTTGLTIGRDMRLVVPFWSQLMTAQEAVQEEERRALNRDDNPHPDAEVELPLGLVDDDGPAFVPFVAERIEIWMDDEQLWWWRALDPEGAIIWNDSAVNEQSVIEAAALRFPGCPVHQIPRELDDSRNRQQYGPPQRLWNRGAQ